MEVPDQSIVDCFGQITEISPSGSKRDCARLVAEQLHLTTKQVYDALERVKLGELEKDQPSRG
jgi:hypothetical protein